MVKNILLFFVALGVVTVILGTVYGTVQQNYRQTAYDPEIQMAEDTGNMLSQGGDAGEISSTYPQVNFAVSLSPFVIIYDQEGKVVLATGNMDGSVPTPPIGVLQTVMAYGEDRLTWQPRKDVRIATIVVPYSYNGQSGFVLAGRNLREIEVREDNLSFMIFAGWCASVLGLLFYFLLKIFFTHER